MKVTLTFETNEEVTPHLFASKIALACFRHGALRVGEKVEWGPYVFTRLEDKPMSWPPGDDRKFMAPDFTIHKDGELIETFNTV